MPRAETKEGRLTIPISDEVREKLGLHDGDELAAHVVVEGCLPPRPERMMRAVFDTEP